MKDLTSGMTETELSDELKNLGYDVIFVQQLLIILIINIIKNGRKLSIHMVSLHLSPTSKEIFNLTDLLHIRKNRALQIKYRLRILF